MSIFQKAEEVKSAGKFLAFGATSSGKSWFTLTFPKIFAFDSEQGLNFYKDNDNLLQVAPTASMYEMQDGIDEIHSLIDKTPSAVKTVTFDSETKFYQNIQDISLSVEEKRAREKGRDVDDTNLSVRSWGRIKSVSNRLQNMKIDLSSRGINIVSTAHESEIKKEVNNEWVVIGHKPDIYKNLPFDYDVVLRFYTKNEDNEDKETEYWAEVRKDRTQTFKKGDKIKNPSYSMWEDKFTTEISGKSTDYATDTIEDTGKMIEEEGAEDRKKKIIDVLKKAIAQESKKDSNIKLEVSKKLKEHETSLKGLSDLDLSKVEEIKDDIILILKPKKDK